MAVALRPTTPLQTSPHSKSTHALSNLRLAPRHATCQTAHRCGLAQISKQAGPPSTAAVPLEASQIWRLQAGHAIQSVLAAAGRTAALAAACASLLLGAPQSAPADTLIRVPAAEDPAIFTAQQTLLEAWRIVADTYEDPTFNGVNWENALAEGLVGAAFSQSAPEAYGEIVRMLDGLGDPYTRIIPASDFRNFRIGTDGELQGVGLMIAKDPNSRRLLVLASIQGSPAARAGIRPGDEVVSIDGTETEGFSNDKAAALLRGNAGTSVTVRFARRSPQVPGVAGRPEAPPQVQDLKVNMKRERLEVSPVFSTAVQHNGPSGPSTTGYIRLVNFSMHAADDVTKAIKDLKAQGASSWILDLRQNPGGLVRAGVDVARLFLDAPAPVFNVAGRGQGPSAASEAAGRAVDSAAVQAPHPAQIMQKVVLGSSHALTKQPLAVLLDGQSASASEILAGALKDNGHRAVLIGDQHTYGKGKIQNVHELTDGSALFVTVARYKTPADTDIDKVGITPDISCHALDLPRLDAPPPEERLLPEGLPPGLAMQLQGPDSLRSDACVATAEAFLDGLVASNTRAHPSSGLLARWK